MEQYSPILPVLADDELSPRAAAVFADIRETRGTDFVNNFWRVLAHDPENLERTWAELKAIMGPGTSLDPLTKELIYVAVSTVNGCTYCVRSHTAAARAKGATDEQIAELHGIVGAANKTNRMAVGLQVPVDECFC
ncbi:MAG: carboxymuconolactone decarboxylase family protein [Tessaracoccus sp.]|uniref:carboxymuconolactone decarboxylase family protein n=1 Tax=Tessaracoccus sp. TaxID=1971211 RepID=UPI001EB932A5|nr:carboxymuconolactone decarboxylase family protein [Tessaracoccus sp.]MBK7821738.1 carboxymuconolactone decarboxylase family protein [Tessaracoccus sp.]